MRKRGSIDYQTLNDCCRPDAKMWKQQDGSCAPAREKQYRLNEEKALNKKRELFGKTLTYSMKTSRTITFMTCRLTCMNFTKQ